MAKKKKITIVVKPDAKHRITTQEEMQNFLHMKRKGASTTQNGKAYKRKTSQSLSLIRYIADFRPKTTFLVTNGVAPHTPIFF